MRSCRDFPTGQACASRRCGGGKVSAEEVEPVSSEMHSPAESLLNLRGWSAQFLRFRCTTPTVWVLWGDGICTKKAIFLDFDEMVENYDAKSLGFDGHTSEEICAYLRSLFDKQKLRACHVVAIEFAICENNKGRRN